MPVNRSSETKRQQWLTGILPARGIGVSEMRLVKCGVDFDRTLGVHDRAKKEGMVGCAAV